jgi:hypothetical protein
MIVVECHDIELDHCVRCHGVWFDTGEVELLLESLGLAEVDILGDIFSSPEAASAEKRHRCPIHGQRMKKVAIGRRPEVVIDACLKGDGLWFDGGEVHQLVRQLTPVPSGESGPQRVADFLRWAFQAEG